MHCLEGCAAIDLFCSRAAGWMKQLMVSFWILRRAIARRKVNDLLSTNDSWCISQSVTKCFQDKLLWRTPHGITKKTQQGHTVHTSIHHTSQKTGFYYRKGTPLILRGSTSLNSGLTPPRLVLTLYRLEVEARFRHSLAPFVVVQPVVNTAQRFSTKEGKCQNLLSTNDSWCISAQSVTKCFQDKLLWWTPNETTKKYRKAIQSSPACTTRPKKQASTIEKVLHWYWEVA